jgi:hypothetical protein
MNVQSMAPACSRLRGREGHPDPLGTAPPRVVKQCAPPTSEVEDAPSGADADHFGDVIVLAALSLLEGQREVPVVFGAAEVSQFTKTPPKYSIDCGVRELDVYTVSHDRIVLSRR